MKGEKRCYNTCTCAVFSAYGHHLIKDVVMETLVTTAIKENFNHKIPAFQLMDLLHVSLAVESFTCSRVDVYDTLHGYLTATRCGGLSACDL